MFFQLSLTALTFRFAVGPLVVRVFDIDPNPFVLILRIGSEDLSDFSEFFAGFLNLSRQIINRLDI
ncbi:hypothetical protein BRW65_27770 [Mycobacterium paraffinicum]|uniref:Uncharacterized protein n=1 Tax=Mycobacterium paraffinicum TaxID=53378 RepID=A0A1Q4HE72_9MYCO|nr:hypothetical protein BRW65_27770 [Mycobacterium paraffinicum]